MLNFTPWKAVYCPLLTVPSWSKQEGPDSWTILRRHTAQLLQEKQHNSLSSYSRLINIRHETKQIAESGGKMEEGGRRGALVLILSLFLSLMER